MNPLTLNKVSLDDKKALLECLEFYINDLHHIKMQELEKVLETIAKRLYFRWLGSVNKLSPAKKSNLKLPYDEGYILKTAIIRNQRIANLDQLQHAKLERFKFEIDSQLV